MRRFAYPLIQAAKEEISSIFVTIDKYAKLSPFTLIYGLARSLLASALLLTLLFNDIPTLYAEHIFSAIDSNRAIFRINLFFWFEYDQLWIPRLISIIMLFSVISGYLPQITGVLHWWISYCFFNSAIIVGGGDQINSVLTFLLIPITLADNRLNHWYKSKEGNPYRNLIAWGFFILIELQGAVLYLQAGIEKPYKVAEWRDGTAIYYWMNHNLFGTNDLFLRFLNPVLTNNIFAFLITWGTIILELTIFGAFFMYPRRRIPIFLIALGFHFLILVFHGLFSFFLSVSGLLLIYLVNRYYILKVDKNGI